MLTDKTGIIISNTQNVCSNFKSYSSWHFLFPNYVACTRSQFTCSHAPCVCLSGGNPRILSTKDIMLDSLRHFQKTCNLLETKISVNKFEKMTNFKANHLYFSNIKNMKFEIKGRSDVSFNCCPSYSASLGKVVHCIAKSQKGEDENRPCLLAYPI